MKTIAKTVTVMALATALGGCQMLHLPKLSFKPRAKVENAQWVPAAKTDFAAALDEGRFQLKSGNVSAAAALFRIAQGSEETRGDALNGLAVAYTKLGRPDVAERYFLAAIQEQPTNRKFAANLERLQERLMIDRQLAVQASQAKELATATADVQSLLSERAPQVRRAVVAQSTRGMVFIKTPETLDRAPAMTVASRTEKTPVAKADPAAVAAAEAETPQLTHVAAAIPASKVVYPVRIELDQ